MEELKRFWQRISGKRVSDQYDIATMDHKDVEEMVLELIHTEKLEQMVLLSSGGSIDGFATKRIGSVQSQKTLPTSVLTEVIEGAVEYYGGGMDSADRRTEAAKNKAMAGLVTKALKLAVKKRADCQLTWKFGLLNLAMDVETDAKTGAEKVSYMADAVYLIPDNDDLPLPGRRKKKQPDLKLKKSGTAARNWALVFWLVFSIGQLLMISSGQLPGFSASWQDIKNFIGNAFDVRWSWMLGVPAGVLVINLLAPGFYQKRIPSFWLAVALSFGLVVPAYFVAGLGGAYDELRFLLMQWWYGVLLILVATAMPKTFKPLEKTGMVEIFSLWGLACGAVAFSFTTGIFFEKIAIFYTSVKNFAIGVAIFMGWYLFFMFVLPFLAGLLKIVGFILSPVKWLWKNLIKPQMKKVAALLFGKLLNSLKKARNKLAKAVGVLADEWDSEEAIQSILDLVDPDPYQHSAVSGPNSPPNPKPQTPPSEPITDNDPPFVEGEVVDEEQVPGFTPNRDVEDGDFDVMDDSVRLAALELLQKAESNDHAAIAQVRAIMSGQKALPSGSDGSDEQGLVHVTKDILLELFNEQNKNK